MAQLPDPTVDLDWSGFEASIQSHFRANAEKHPDRTCVVETKSAGAEERSFTYKQIYEASNILAHHLHENGVTNDHVVMIWAHRSVDLVISIMGILTSGATFSVLDPSYPPEKQKVHLEVAQPRALINIARATDQAGPLSTIVRKFIDEELNLKAEVRALRLLDDGVLSGVEAGVSDCFAQVRSKASMPPDVLVGPDSVPTLSFTSGSEGRPKGVRGRHFSLTKYFGWMAERFQLSSDSRFTMLSGIAHDPIQRDIFTPLFLGATLLVPSAEDIQHERLAEWMHEHKPTVTHLTPAMGQILVGGASAEFPSLDRAFFVGDILTTRDCRSLQKLAVNAYIVNMYGTTETQRSVSYYEVPSRAKDPDYLNNLGKDTIPAGKGMKNVQLLVVHTEDRTKMCNVGEVGEIYVRAAGLAEGYKGDESLNEKKFLMNWFVDNQRWAEADKNASKNESWRQYYKGPRDRLYRTGDLGKYWESGDVECTGRADDQVKVRGFRVELNEIDSNLGSHPLVRDCKTIQRDRKELISYIVPEMKEWPQYLESHGLEDTHEDGIDAGPTKIFPKRFRPMQDAVREHLRQKLPSYAVPTYFVVLQKLPLNPNGKVDRPNLPAPGIAGADEVSDEDLQRWESLGEIERLVASAWSNVIPGLNPKTLASDSDFFDLGGNSLNAQQMIVHVRKDTGAKASISTLYQNPNFAGFCAQVAKLLGSTNGAAGTVDEIPAYTHSFDHLVKQLPATFATADPTNVSTIFLTGATGFLGAYIIKDVLQRTHRSLHLTAHVRGVKDSSAGLDRLKKSLQGYGIWQEEWSTRLSCVVGDLSKPQLGISQEDWQALSQTVDVVIHNGASVHWINRYQDMLPSNVLSTIDAMRLCNEGKPKNFAFVSSTSALDTDHYVKLSNGGNAVLEEDDLQGSRTGLGTGYGQTKWVSEALIRCAGERGLRGTIIRPGYILGDSETGVSNTDDFLLRMLKGCIQLSARPNIANTVNSVPVDHVARVVVAAALNSLPGGVHVAHVTAHPRLRMNEYLSFLEHYGYKTPEVPYNTWKDLLENYVAVAEQKGLEQHALMPLLDFCVSDLPANTQAPELDDRNTVQILKNDADTWTGEDRRAGSGLDTLLLGKILSYLVEIGFLERPREGEARLPELRLSEAQLRAAVGGRGASK